MRLSVSASSPRTGCAVGTVSSCIHSSFCLRSACYMGQPWRPSFPLQTDCWGNTPLRRLCCSPHALGTCIAFVSGTELPVTKPLVGVLLTHKILQNASNSISSILFPKSTSFRFCVCDTCLCLYLGIDSCLSLSYSHHLKMKARAEPSTQPRK